MQCKSFSIISCRLSVCLFEETNWMLVCLLSCTRKVRNSLGSLFYTLAVWPHVQRRQHSSCYRYASVRVVMVAAQPEISSCYLWSAENVPFATTKHALPHPITWVQVTHEDCYFVFCPQMLPMSWHFPCTAKLNFTGTKKLKASLKAWGFLLKKIFVRCGSKLITKKHKILIKTVFGVKITLFSVEIGSEWINTMTAT